MRQSKLNPDKLQVKTRFYSKEYYCLQGRKSLLREYTNVCVNKCTGAISLIWMVGNPRPVPLNPAKTPHQYNLLNQAIKLTQTFKSLLISLLII